MTRQELLITVTVMFGVIMAIIDMTIVNVALPTIAGNLGASLNDAAWVATGYILAAVVVMPLNGWLTAYLGRKRFYCGAIALFTVASLLCGLTHSIVTLTMCRMLQGLGGGVLQPTAQSILYETFGPKRAAGAMAIFGLGIMVAPALGPVLGGYIVDNASWPLIFLIKHTDRHRHVLDGAGIRSEPRVHRAYEAADRLARTRPDGAGPDRSAVCPRKRSARRLAEFADDRLVRDRLRRLAAHVRGDDGTRRASGRRFADLPHPELRPREHRAFCGRFRLVRQRADRAALLSEHPRDDGARLGRGVDSPAPSRPPSRWWRRHA